MRFIKPWAKALLRTGKFRPVARILLDVDEVYFVFAAFFLLPPSAIAAQQTERILRRERWEREGII